MPEQFWFLLAKKLNGDASHEELLQLQHYMLQNEDLAQQALQIENEWHNNAEPISAESAEDAFSRLLISLSPGDRELFAQAKESGSGPNNRKRVLAMASAIAAMVLVALFYAMPKKAADKSQDSKQGGEQIVATPTGSRSIISLPDGSEVRLNAGTELRYNDVFDDTLREVWLTGEAFFTIKENKERPFVVHTRDYDVRVTGTVFNVRAYAEENSSETALVTGGVQIEMRDGSNVYKLKPNEKFSHRQGQYKLAAQSGAAPVLTASSAVVPLLNDEHIQLPTETAWVYNQLAFQTENFGSVARKMSYWYGVEIRITDSTLSREMLSGYFTTETLSEALEILQFTTPFNYTIQKRRVTISPK